MAMRDLSRSFLAARRAEKRSTHPFYWASFSASGR
jgi:CHAT domain-containing protein